MSVNVLVSGSGPSTTSAETVVTVSPASLDSSPNPTTAGNAIPAVNTPAIRHKPSKRAIGRTSRLRGATMWKRTGRGRSPFARIVGERLALGQLSVRRGESAKGGQGRGIVRWSRSATDSQNRSPRGAEVDGLSGSTVVIGWGLGVALV